MSTFQWNAADYRRYSRAQQGWARELIAKLDLQGDEQVMDLGCGDGKVTVEIAAQLPRGQVLGVDSSSSMIQLARQAYPRSGYPNMRFVTGDARELACAQGFDVVFSNAALHWIKDHRPVVAGLSRCVRRGGRILLQMGGEGNAAGILPVVEAVMAEPQWCDYFRDFVSSYGFLGVVEYESLLADYGFTPRRVELIPKDMRHQGEDGLAGWLRTTWMPYTNCVPEVVREPFIRDITTRYLEQVPMDSAGIVHVDMVRIEVDAIRNRP